MASSRTPLPAPALALAAQLTTITPERLFASPTPLWQASFAAVEAATAGRQLSGAWNHSRV